MKKVLIIEPNPSGHCAFYLSLIVQAFPDAKITLLAPPHDEAILDHFRRRGLDPGRFTFTTPDGTGAASVVAQAAGIAGGGGFSEVFFSYIDTYLPALFQRAGDFPCPVSGIWFHPYDLDRKYRWLPPLDKRLRRRARVNRALRNLPSGLVFGHLFFLDGDAVEKLNSINPGIPCSVLPDPWEKRPALGKVEARERFGLPQDRRIFLHIGGSEKRKGLPDAIAAFRMVAGSGAANPLLLRVGDNTGVRSGDASDLRRLEKAGHARIVEGYVPEEDFMEYFAASDWILLPYRKFRFSSGILSNAVGAGRPVIAADHGMIGATVRKQSLGILYKHGTVPSLRNAIREAVASPPFNPATRVAEGLSPECFVAALRDGLSH